MVLTSLGKYGVHSFCSFKDWIHPCSRMYDFLWTFDCVWYLLLGVLRRSGYFMCISFFVGCLVFCFVLCFVCLCEPSICLQFYWVLYLRFVFVLCYTVLLFYLLFYNKVKKRKEKENSGSTCCKLRVTSVTSIRYEYIWGPATWWRRRTCTWTLHTLM